MAKSLIIVESPAKAKTIKKILGKGYQVLPSMGHVKDLPKSRLGVDVEKGFVPSYIVIKDRKKVLNEILDASRQAKTVYLAPDPDREGEAIAWHIAEAIRDGGAVNKKKGKKEKKAAAPPPRRDPAGSLPRDHEKGDREGDGGPPPPRPEQV